MNNLQHRQSKIQEKRKQTPWRDFVMEIASWFSMNYYKVPGGLSRYPDTSRVAMVENFELRQQSYSGYFFQDYNTLSQQVGQIRVFQDITNENCEFSDVTMGSKHVYLSSVTANAINILYSTNVKTSYDVYNSMAVWDHSSLIYQSVGIIKSSEVFYSQNIQDSSDIWFCSELVGCSHCIGCSQLQNASYYINNQQYSKEEFFLQKQVVLGNKSQFETKYPQRPYNNIVLCCENVTNSYSVYNIKNGNNIYLTGGFNDKEEIYDAFASGATDHMYGVIGAVAQSSHIYCSIHIRGSHQIYYSQFLENCSFCLGCIWLTNKSYYILNKQYTKEEWYEKVDEIFGQMEADGTLGQFFPASMNPFYFNDTAAYLIDTSFTKDEVVAKGYLWRDEPIKVDIPEWMEVVESRDLDKFEKLENGVRSIDPIILKKTIRDEEGNVYRVIKLEYDFLMKYGLPLPRKHRLTRMKENFRIS